MKTIKLITMLIVLIVVGLLFTSFPAMNQYYWIKNMTNYTITIEAEFEPNGWESPRRWFGVYQNESNERIGLLIYSEPPFLFRILPGTEIAPFVSPAHTRLREIPPLQRFRLAFISFIIKDEAGNTIKTLDDLIDDDFIIDKYGDVFLFIH